MKQVVARAGSRTRVLHIVSDSIPQQVRFAASTVEPRGALKGTVEVVMSRWFLRRPPEIHPLLPEQSFHKGFADTTFAIYVTPASDDVMIAFRSRHLESRTLAWILGGVLLLGLVGAIVSVLVAPAGP